MDLPSHFVPCAGASDIKPATVAAASVAQQPADGRHSLACTAPVLVQRPCSHFDERPDPTDISLLVIHNISLPPGQFGTPYIDDFFAGQLDCSQHPYFQQLQGVRVSAHCVIYRDGRIWQYVPFAKRAWHAGLSQFDGRDKCNDFSIGIELEGTDTEPYTEQQYQSLLKLTLYLQQLYPAIVPARIKGHQHIAPGRKTDPGPAFNWPDFFKALADLSSQLQASNMDNQDVGPASAPTETGVQV